VHCAWHSHRRLFFGGLAKVAVRDRAQRLVTGTARLSWTVPTLGAGVGGRVGSSWDEKGVGCTTISGTASSPSI
jgi:hypothetical protein